MRPITASALGRLAICPGQAVISHMPWHSREAEQGRRDHEELLPAMLHGELPDTDKGRALAKVRERVPDCARLEVAYAVDLENMTARELVTEYPRDYRDARPGEIPGTTDLDAPDYIGEAKFGSYQVDAPKWNAQMWHAALARFLAHGARVRMHLFQVGDHPFPRQEEYTPTVADLMGWRARLLRTVEIVRHAQEAQERGEEPRLTLGPHCGLCDARLECPALQRIPARHANDGEEYLAASADVARAKRRLELAQAILAGRDTALEDGRVLRARTRYKRTVDPERAINLVPGLAARAKRTVTAKDLDVLAGDREDLGENKYQRKRALTDYLAERGAIEITASTVYEIEESG